jgi:DNA-directed RNA polymerase beta subunit
LPKTASIAQAAFEFSTVFTEEGGEFRRNGQFSIMFELELAMFEYGCWFASYFVWTTDERFPFFYCVLSDKTTLTAAEVGECQFDKHGQFLINGAEKILTSIEKMLDNDCLVFDVNDAKFSDAATTRYFHFTFAGVDVYRPY